MSVDVIGYRRKSKKDNEIKTVRQERKDERFVGPYCLEPGVGHLNSR